MKILFDECVPKRLRRYLHIHEVITTQEAGWAGIKNGQLLEKASTQFEAFITVDRNMSFQQNPKSFPLPVIVLHAESNKLKDLEKFSPDILKLLNSKLNNTAYHLAV